MFAGSMRATAGTEGLARYDLNINGPFGDDWRFNVGGFYRYDHGVRDPGFPGIRGGQLKASITRLLNNGYIRFSVEVHRRPQPVHHSAPLHQRRRSRSTSRDSATTARMNTQRGPGPHRAHAERPAARCRWTTGSGPRPPGSRTMWGSTSRRTGTSRTPRRSCRTIRSGTRIPSGSLFTAQDFITAPRNRAGWASPPAAPASSSSPTTSTRRAIRFRSTPRTASWHPRGRVARREADLGDSGSVHVAAEIRTRTPYRIGGYFANYTQDQPLVLHRHPDRRARQSRDSSTWSSRRREASRTRSPRTGSGQFLSNYVERHGSDIDRVAAWWAARSSSPTGSAPTSACGSSTTTTCSSRRTPRPFDLDGDSTTTVDNMNFGNNTFRHFTKNITDWVGVGRDSTTDSTTTLSLYAAAARGYKMPALDEFLNAQAQAQVDVFEAREVQSVEGGVKYADRPGRDHGERVLHQAQEHHRPGSGHRRRRVDHVAGDRRSRTAGRTGPRWRPYVLLFEGLQLQGSAHLPQGRAGPRYRQLGRASGSPAFRPRSATWPRSSRRRGRSACSSRPTGTMSARGFTRSPARPVATAPSCPTTTTSISASAS